MKLKSLLIGAVLLCVMSGCVSRPTYPLGLTRFQWNSLTPDEQAEAQARQDERDERRYLRTKEFSDAIGERNMSRDDSPPNPVESYTGDGSP